MAGLTTSKTRESQGSASWVLINQRKSRAGSGCRSLHDSRTQRDSSFNHCGRAAQGVGAHINALTADAGHRGSSGYPHMSLVGLRTKRAQSFGPIQNAIFSVFSAKKQKAVPCRQRLLPARRLLGVWGRKERLGAIGELRRNRRVRSCHRWLLCGLQDFHATKTRQ